MKHTAVRVGPFEICLACHLLWPCLDGKILTAPRRDPGGTSAAWFTVNQIREALR